MKIGINYMKLYENYMKINMKLYVNYMKIKKKIIWKL